ncbi:hypothetical protein NN561_013638 [Cricetulus griseus]
MACREEGSEPAAAAAATVRSPELPCSRPPPGDRPLARAPLAALPPSPALAPRSFQLSKRQPRPRPHRLGTPPAPARPELCRRPPEACSSLARLLVARAPAARPAPPAPPSAPSAPLPLPSPPPLVYLELNRTWLPRQERGGRPRPATDGRDGQSARGGGPGGREGRLSARPRQSRCASSVSRCPLVRWPGERRASPGAGVGRRRREGLGPGPEHPAGAAGTGRCGSSRRGRRGPRLARRAPFRVALVPGAPALPALILPSAGQDPGRPSSPPHPGLPAPSPAP